MHIIHFFLCIFYKAKLDINNPGYYGQPDVILKCKGLFYCLGVIPTSHKNMRSIPDVECRTPMGFFFILSENLC